MAADIECLLGAPHCAECVVCFLEKMVPELSPQGRIGVSQVHEGRAFQEREQHEQRVEA